MRDFRQFDRRLERLGKVYEPQAKPFDSTQLTRYAWRMLFIVKRAQQAELLPARFSFEDEDFQEVIAKLHELAAEEVAIQRRVEYKNPEPVTNEEREWRSCDELSDWMKKRQDDRDHG